MLRKHNAIHKTELHSIWQRRPKRAEPWPQASCTDRPCVFFRIRWAHRQTDELTYSSQYFEHLPGVNTHTERRCLAHKYLPIIAWRDVIDQLLPPLPSFNGHRTVCSRRLSADALAARIGDVNNALVLTMKRKVDKRDRVCGKRWRASAAAWRLNSDDEVMQILLSLTLSNVQIFFATTPYRTPYQRNIDAPCTAYAYDK